MVRLILRDGCDGPATRWWPNFPAVPVRTVGRWTRPLYHTSEEGGNGGPGPRQARPPHRRQRLNQLISACCVVEVKRVRCRPVNYLTAREPTASYVVGGEGCVCWCGGVQMTFAVTLVSAADGDVKKMSRTRMKRCVQTVMLAMVLAYSTLLIYQTLSHGLGARQMVDGGKLADAAISQLVRAGEGAVVNQPDSLTSEIMPSVTATRKPLTTTLQDVFISIKTTKSYHQQRLPIILKTWFQLAKHQTWFFTDTDDAEFQEKTNGHMINTNCSSSHNRKALCCKMSVEFDTFIETDKKWFCHFDDDNYVNVPRLVRLLEDYNPQEDWYLGKPSIRAPLEILNKEKNPQKISFWFATGGAGFCVSRALALKMVPVASGGKFISVGEKIRLPDDVTMGYIIEHLLRKPLTVVDQFHSHFEPMKFLRRDTLHDQISFSYSRSREESNVVKIDGFDVKYDPNRFLSLHCFLFPYFRFCPR